MMGYDEKRVIEALVLIAKRRHIDVEKDSEFRRAAAVVILENRGLTIGGGQRKI